MPTLAPTPFPTPDLLESFESLDYYSGNTLTATFSNVQVGDELVVGIGRTYSVAVTPPSGWNTLYNTNNTTENNEFSVYQTTATSTQNSYTFTLPSGFGDVAELVAVHIRRGLAPSSSIIIQEDGSTAFTSQTVNAGAGSVNIVLVGDFNGGSTDTFSSFNAGWSALYQSTQPYYGVYAFENTTSIGQVGLTASRTNSRALIGVTLNFAYGTPAPTPVPTVAPTPVVTPTPIVTATPSPSPTSVSLMGPFSSIKKIVPTTGAYPWYPSSVYHVALPANPVVVPAATAAAWLAQQSPGQFGSITIDPSGKNANDGGNPVTYTDGDGQNVTISCTATSYSQYACNDADSVKNMNGATVAIPFPASGGLIAEGTTDHHVGNIDTVALTELSTWDAYPTPSAPGQTWVVGGAGECNVLGNGFNCSGATASNIPLSLGDIDPFALMVCLSNGDPHCVLPTAVSIAVRCDNGYEFPAGYGDSQCFSPTTGANQSVTGQIHEGKRVFLTGTLATDDLINANTSMNAVSKIIARTMDSQHYGAIIRDSAWSGGSGLQLQWLSAQAWTEFGMPDPWIPVAQAVGVNTSSGAFVIPISIPLTSWGACANSKNDGLCD